MKEYIATKLLLLIPTVLAITLLVFAMMRFIPGDPIHEIMPGCPTACGGEEWHPC